MAFFNSKGFTLLEVAASLAILGIGVLMALRLFSGGLRLSKASEGRTYMALLAREKLSEAFLKKDLEEGSFTGQEGGYTWRLDINRFNKDKKLKINPDARVLRLDVEVSRAGSGRGFLVSTLRTFSSP